MSLLRLGDSCKTSRGTETLNASMLKGLVSAVICLLHAYRILHAGIYSAYSFESQNMISSNPLPKKNPLKIAKVFAQKYKLAWPE